MAVWKEICDYCGEEIEGFDRVIGVTTYKSLNKLYHPKCYKEMTETE